MKCQCREQRWPRASGLSGARFSSAAYAPEAQGESTGVIDAAQHAIMSGLVGARGVLRELALDFGAEVDAGHLGQAGEVDEDVCKFFAA